MNYEDLKLLIDKRYTRKEISKHFSLSMTTVVYWLKKYKLTSHKKSEGIYRYCPKCDTKKLKTDFYNRKNKKGQSCYCKPCTLNETKERLRIFKSKCIEYKGGKCVICNYNRCQGSLHFHHLDPEKKEFGIAAIRQTSFNDKAKEELDKCILVCANCHGEIHGDLIILENGAPRKI